MARVEYVLDDKIAVLTMNDGENRFNPPFLEEFLTVLDEIEKDTGANVLLVKSAHEKIFSNGIDLDWLLPAIEKKETKTAVEFIYQMMKLFRRITIYPMITIAAMTGHAFAGGAIMSCYFDYRFMRSDRGYLCFPEVDLGIPLLPGMLAGMKKVIPHNKLVELIYQAKRITADECEAHNIITKSCHIDTLVDEALNFAKSIDKRREIVIELKKEMNKDILYAMDVEDSPIIDRGRLHV